MGEGWLGDGFAGVATGVSFADALGGGVSCGEKGGVLLLTDASSLSPEAAAFITAHPDLAAVAVFGGAGAVADAVLAQIAALL
ncbi:MAG: cell wall-binding repeat-containing protein [Actinobacteria bacterium]|nr:MAG: cell wall-binding repeat-containing protein [Actinomycetota bacterium]